MTIGLGEPIFYSAVVYVQVFQNYF